MIESAGMSSLAAICSIVLVRLATRSWPPLIRSSVAVLALVTGAAVTIYVGGGFGWGWPNLTAGKGRMILVAQGLGLGVSFLAFAWIASRRISALRAILLVAANMAIVVLPEELYPLRIALLELANAALLFEWLYGFRKQSSGQMVQRPA